MTQHDLILSLRTLCRTHVEREDGNFALVYGDLLVELPTIIAPYRDNGDEFYIAIRPFGFECCSTLTALYNKLSLFTNQTMLVYVVVITRFEDGSISYDIKYLTTRINR